jgi:hypothetical protein
MRMDAAVVADVDPFDRHAGQPEETLGELALRRGQSEDGATVIGIDVEVEKPCRRTPPLDGLERATITPLADVRDGEEKRP